MTRVGLIVNFAPQPRGRSQFLWIASSGGMGGMSEKRHTDWLYLHQPRVARSGPVGPSQEDFESAAATRKKSVCCDRASRLYPRIQTFITRILGTERRNDIAATTSPALTPTTPVNIITVLPECHTQINACMCNHGFNSKQFPCIPEDLAILE